MGTSGHHRVTASAIREAPPTTEHAPIHSRICQYWVAILDDPFRIRQLVHIQAWHSAKDCSVSVALTFWPLISRSLVLQVHKALMLPLGRLGRCTLAIHHVVVVVVLGADRSLLSPEAYVHIQMTLQQTSSAVCRATCTGAWFPWPNIAMRYDPRKVLGNISCNTPSKRRSRLLI